MDDAKLLVTYLKQLHDEMHAEEPDGELMASLFTAIDTLKHNSWPTFTWRQKIRIWLWTIRTGT